MGLNSYHFPSIDGVEPLWNGESFTVNNLELPILEYSSNLVGWNEELTNMHEDLLGAAHPIDVSSRTFALNTIIHICESNANPVIMEIGCSSGYLLRELRNFDNNLSIIGVDVIKGPLLRISSERLKIPLLVFDLVNNPMPDSSVDVVILLNVLEHIDDDYKALEQAKRICRSGGRIVIEVPYGDHLYDAYDKELLHFRRYSAERLFRFAESLNMEVESYNYSGFLLYPFFFFIKSFRRFFKVSPSDVVNNNSKHTKNKFVGIVFAIERFIAKYITLPVGIRLQIVLNVEK